MAWKEYERKAISLFVRDQLPGSTLDEVLGANISVDVDETGVGYFATVRNASLPVERLVFDAPMLLGTSGDTQVGFVVFVMDRELTLECYLVDGGMLPASLRDLAFDVGEAAY